MTCRSWRCQWRRTQRRPAGEAAIVARPSHRRCGHPQQAQRTLLPFSAGSSSPFSPSMRLSPLLVPLQQPLITQRHWCANPSHHATPPVRHSTFLSYMGHSSHVSFETITAFSARALRSLGSSHPGLGRRPRRLPVVVLGAEKFRRGPYPPPHARSLRYTHGWNGNVGVVPKRGGSPGPQRGSERKKGCALSHKSDIDQWHAPGGVTW